MPVVDVGDRLATPHGRLDLARQVLGIMFHPKSLEGRKLRQSAFAETLLAMSDENDEPEALHQAKAWFKQAGGFKTASRTHPYEEQQQKAARQVPGIVAVAALINLVWSLDAHHRDELAGGASLNKAVALYTEFPYFASMAVRTLWTLWDRYKDVAHLCAAFALVFEEARREPLERLDELMKRGFDEDLHKTLSVAAAYQNFGTTFIPQAMETGLLNPKTAWVLRGIEHDPNFLPPALPLEMIAVARSYRAPLNPAYR